MARSLQALTDLAVDVARGFKAINELRLGKNGTNAAALADILERRLRNVVSGRMKARRRAVKAARDSRGRFLR